MPIYDYNCGRCRKVTEVIHGIHAAGPKFCPECGAAGTMSKGITTSAVHFKGSGWAKKDRSASASAGRSHGSKAGGEAAGGGSGDAAREGTGGSGAIPKTTGDTASSTSAAGAATTASPDAGT